MLKYERREARRGTGLFILLLIGALVGVSTLISNDISLQLPAPGMAESVSMLTFVVVMVSGLLILQPVLLNNMHKMAVLSRGRLIATNEPEQAYPESFSSRRFGSRHSFATVYDALERALTGTIVKPMPLARGVWTLDRSDRVEGKLSLNLRIQDPVRKNSYIRWLRLYIDVIRQDGVTVERRYEAGSPLMLKKARNVIHQTDTVIDEILSMSRGTIFDTIQQPVLTVDTSEEARDELMADTRNSINDASTDSSDGTYPQDFAATTSYQDTSYDLPSYDPSLDSSLNETYEALTSGITLPETVIPSSFEKSLD